jgi:hypothetical protein
VSRVHERSAAAVANGSESARVDPAAGSARDE